MRALHLQGILALLVSRVEAAAHIGKEEVAVVPGAGKQEAKARKDAIERQRAV